ncbi:CopG family ribbon-helix-helix protein [Escherichia coli]
MKSRKSGSFSLRLDADLLEKVNACAEAKSLTRTDIINEAVRAYFGAELDVSAVGSGDKLDAVINLLSDISEKLEHGKPRKAARCNPVVTQYVAPAITDELQDESRGVLQRNSPPGRYDEDAVMTMIRQMREEQRASGFRYDNKLIAQALNDAGLLQSNGNPWNNDRVNTVITRKMPDLK